MPKASATSADRQSHGRGERAFGRACRDVADKAGRAQQDRGNRGQDREGGDRHKQIAAADRRTGSIACAVKSATRKADRHEAAPDGEHRRLPAFRRNRRKQRRRGDHQHQIAGAFDKPGGEDRGRRANSASAMPPMRHHDGAGEEGAGRAGTLDGPAGRKCGRRHEDADHRGEPADQHQREADLVAGTIRPAARSCRVARRPGCRPAGARRSPQAGRPCHFHWNAECARSQAPATRSGRRTKNRRASWPGGLCQDCRRSIRAGVVFM